MRPRRRIALVPRRIAPFALSSAIASCAHAPTPSRAPSPAATPLVASVAPTPTGCAPLGLEGPTQTLTLLGGRLRIALPADAHTEGPAASTPGFISRRGFAYLQRGRYQLTLIASETLGRADASLDGYVREQAHGGTVETARFAGAEAPLVLVPDAAPRTGDVTVARAYLPMPEGTVTTVEVAVTSVDEPMVASRCTELARAALARLEAGTARYDRGTGPVAIGPLMTLDLPAGVVAEQLSSGDEPTVVFAAVHALGEDEPRLTVTVTQHPPSISMPVDRAGLFLGRHVSWRNLYGGPGHERRSAVLRIPGHDEYAYALAEAPTLEGVGTMMDLASRIRPRR